MDKTPNASHQRENYYTMHHSVGSLQVKSVEKE
jgi:hypothetical protein